jgi:hypothetical protein
VPISRASVIGASAFEDEPEAAQWLERLRRSEEEREGFIADSLLVLNEAVRAHRLAAGDPYVHEVARRQARSVRVGYGTGEEVAQGNWHAAYVVPEPRKRVGRRQMLAPQEQLAAIIGGRRPAWASEDLLLRARVDVDQGRSAQAALQLRTALETLAAELEVSEGERGAAETADRQALDDATRRVRHLAEGAAGEGLDGAATQALEDALRVAERLVRRRRHREL